MAEPFGIACHELVSSDFRCGSQAVIPNSAQNVRSWVKSRRRFWPTGGLLLANSGSRAIWEQGVSLAYNLANFMRTPALPEAIEHGSLTTLREKLVKMGAKVVRHGRYVTFQLAEIAVPRNLFREILRRIEELRPPPAIPI